jgi:hypothetical protein
VALKIRRKAEGGTGMETCPLIPNQNIREKEDGKSNQSIGLPFSRAMEKDRVTKGLKKIIKMDSPRNSRSNDVPCC